jgi:hypothetical protein
MAGYLANKTIRAWAGALSKGERSTEAKAAVSPPLARQVDKIEQMRAWAYCT